jgi:FlaG/FlaF family flagellin (archaellin)
MPRSRPGKHQRALKRQHDESAIEKLNADLASKRGQSNRTVDGVKKPYRQNDEKKFSTSEVQAIVQAAVTAAVTTTTALLNGEKPKQSTDDTTLKKADTKVEQPRTLAERITGPKKSLAERITGPKRSLADRITFPDRQ